jgi:DNA-binding beta-propeller fold protein YncE
MSSSNARSSTRSSKTIVFLIAASVATLGIRWFGGSSDVSALTHTIGKDRIVSWEALPEAGDMCAMPAGSPSSLAAVPGQAGSGAVAGSAAARADVENRKPVRVVADPDYGFAGIAVDPVRDEVVIADENKSHIIVYDRLENAAPTARSRPKRVIAGEKSFLEYVSSVYVDPANGDIYGINNDTMNWMPVFGREAAGDVTPKRALATPQGAYHIAVDEEARELFITDQDDHAVLIFDKEARSANPRPNQRTQRNAQGGGAQERDASSPRRIIQGSRTQLADPHGIAWDSRRRELFVSNWGLRNERPTLEQAAKLEGREDRQDFPVSRFHTRPGSGEIQPPSITVFAKGAHSDVVPVRVIRGSRTQLNWPTALAVHPDRGELFVANDTTHAVTVYRTDANGDVTPIRVLRGPRSQIMNPTGVAVDLKNNELWVANFGNHSATVYRIDAAGDTPPLRVIRSAPLSSPAPMLSNAHTMAYDAKREEMLVAN